MSTPPGRLVSDKIVPLQTQPDTWGETGVDIGAALTNGHGNVVVQWESTLLRGRGQLPDRGTVWMQATRFGLMAQGDAGDLYAWVTDLTTGKPIANARVEMTTLEPNKSLASFHLTPSRPVFANTGRDGLAHLALTDKPEKIIVAYYGKESVLLPSSQWTWETYGWTRGERQDQKRWFIFDDRKLYRPGETVHIKGWTRVQKAGKSGELVFPTGLKSVDWYVTDERNLPIASGTAPLNAWAGFDFAIDLPKTMNTGATILKVNGVRHYFFVEEFRRPEFEMIGKNESARPIVAGDATGADLMVTAKYYSGETLPGTPVIWTVEASPTTYTPPGREAFTFGQWTPWFYNDDTRESDSQRDTPRAITQQYRGRTGNDGAGHLYLDFDAPVAPGRGGVSPTRPYFLDANSEKLFADRGHPLAIEAVACDIDGALDAGRKIQFQAVRRSWNYVKGRWQQSEVDAQSWMARSSAAPITTRFTPKTGGQWVVRATVLDDRQRPNESELMLWVSGENARPGRQPRYLRQESATLIPARKEYRAGQTAEILVKSPFASAEGLATISADGIVSTQRFTMRGDSYTLHVLIGENDLPNLGISVNLVGSALRSDDNGVPIPGLPPRPAYASGYLNLEVSTATRRLTVTTILEQTVLEPGGTTKVSLGVRDAEGKPAACAEVAVAVVDESVLALAGWKLEDPLEVFYPHRYTIVAARNMRSAIVLEDPSYSGRNVSPARSDSPRKRI